MRLTQNYGQGNKIKEKKCGIIFQFLLFIANNVCTIKAPTKSHVVYSCQHNHSHIVMELNYASLVSKLQESSYPLDFNTNASQEQRMLSVLVTQRILRHSETGLQLANLLRFLNVLPKGTKWKTFSLMDNKQIKNRKIINFKEMNINKKFPCWNNTTKICWAKGFCPDKSRDMYFFALSTMVFTTLSSCRMSERRPKQHWSCSKNYHTALRETSQIVHTV